MEPGNTDVVALAALVSELPEDLWRQAFTHHTWVKDDRESYKRLAFIGDSVLGLFVAEHLNTRFPDTKAGLLTQIRSRSVTGMSCKAVGCALGIPAVLEAIEEPALPRAVPTETLLEAARPTAEITEALIGASHLTFGFARTRDPVLAAFEPHIRAAIESPLDPKTMLQQLLSRRGIEASYEVVSKTGTDIDPKFEVTVSVDTRQIGKGTGRSKKAAEHAAAACALEQLDPEPDPQP